MIARLWHGAVPAAKADEYMRYLERTGLPDYRATPGNRGVYVLRRAEEGVAHFLLVSLWESREAIRAFAGDDMERARYYPEDGARLHTKIFKPKDSAGPFPIILQRTPYGVEDADGSFKSYLRVLAEDGYIFAFQDIRGKFGFRAATHRIYRSPSRASHLEIPVAVAPAGLVP